MKTILVHVADDEGLETRLQAAFDLARAGSGHVTCLQSSPYADYSIGDAGLGAFPVTELLAAVAAQRDALKARVVARLQAESIAWDYRQCDGDAADRLVEHARLADIVVMTAGSVPAAVGGRARAAADLAGDVAVRAPAPVLLVPVGTARLDLAGTALVAWNGSQEAAAAMRAALPMLRLAARVAILAIAEKPGAFGAATAAAWLSRHGVHTDIAEREADPAGIEASIRAAAAEHGAALLVLGAYGHSRLRETLFGGVTRGLVFAPPLPMLLAH